MLRSRSICKHGILQGILKSCGTEVILHIWAFRNTLFIYFIHFHSVSSYPWNAYDVLGHQANYLRKPSAHAAEMESPGQCVNGPTSLCKGPPASPAHALDQGEKQVWAKSCVLINSQAQTLMTFCSGCLEWKNHHLLCFMFLLLPSKIVLFPQPPLKLKNRKNKIS